MKKIVILLFAVVFGMTLSNNIQASNSVVKSNNVETITVLTDWDAILNTYEKYVNEYIALYKKVQAGDMNALNKMASLMEKYEKLANQLEKAEDEMTPEQVARYMKITAKLAKAIE